MHLMDKQQEAYVQQSTVLTEDQGQTFAKVCLSKALVYAIFSLYFPCSITYYSILPGEPQEPAVPAADHRVDGVC